MLIRTGKCLFERAILQSTSGPAQQQREDRTAHSSRGKTEPNLNSNISVCWLLVSWMFVLGPPKSCGRILSAVLCVEL